MTNRMKRVRSGSRIVGGLGVMIAAGMVLAQPARDTRGGDPIAAGVARLLRLDANSDGVLTEAEVADARLSPLLKRADSDQDGRVTQAELTEQLRRELAAIPVGRGFGPGGPPPASPPGPPPGPAPGNPGRPQESPLGQVIPGFLHDELRLTDGQRQQIKELQADVDSRLKKILSDDQLQQWQEMRERGPGRPGRLPAGPPRP